MRDEILKGVARPKEVRRWAERAFRPADRRSERSLPALRIMLEKICKAELSSQFRDKVLRRIDSPQLPFAQYQIDSSARKGGPLEDAALCFFNVLAMNSSLDARTVVVSGVAGALDERIKAVIRQVEANANGCGGQDAVEGLRQMRTDCEAVDTNAIANSWLSGDDPTKARPHMESFSPDEDLLGTGCSSAGS